ncbi:MAG: hypothetical protein ACK4TF_00380 [Thermodesulfovibrionales bacterium]
MKPKKGIRFAGSLLFLIMALIAIRHISGVVQKESLRTYKGIEELQKNFEGLLIPTYFPEFLKWPPSRIVAQKRPYRAIAIELKDKENNIALVLTESEREDFRLQTLYIKDPIETLAHDIKGRKAILRVGSCSPVLKPAETKICSNLSWKEGDYYINITIKSRPFELLKIAESMIHN